MKSTDGWQNYLSELVNARPAPAIDAFQWRDPRAVQHGAGYPRVGESAMKGAACRFWEHGPSRSWR